MCVWSLSGPLFNGGPGGGRTLCVLSFVLLDNRPLTPKTWGIGDWSYLPWVVGSARPVSFVEDSSTHTRLNTGRKRPGLEHY